MFECLTPFHRKITPVMDKSYAFNETADALRYMGEGHVQGKVAITV